MIGEFMLILVINYVGILISTVLHFPLPGTITALLLLFLLLKFKILKLEKNSGLGEALKQGILICSNEYVARMDTDDIAPTERF